MSNLSTLNVCACPTRGAARVAADRKASVVSQCLVIRGLMNGLRSARVAANYGSIVAFEDVWKMTKRTGSQALLLARCVSKRDTRPRSEVRSNLIYLALQQPVAPRTIGWP